VRAGTGDGLLKATCCGVPALTTFTGGFDLFMSFFDSFAAPMRWGKRVGCALVGGSAQRLVHFPQCKNYLFPFQIPGTFHPTSRSLLYIGDNQA